MQREPKIEFKSFVKVGADALKEALKDAKLVSSHVRFVLESDSFTVEVKGDGGDVKAEFEKGSPAIGGNPRKRGCKSNIPIAIS